MPAQTINENYVNAFYEQQLFLLSQAQNVI